jgi:hypothetical protein
LALGKQYPSVVRKIKILSFVKDVMEVGDECNSKYSGVNYNSKYTTK